MSGNQWSPNTDLNPAKNWDYVTGLVGLVYETPFRYDPLKDKFIPWLATGGKWKSQSTYAMTIRKGVTWSDGKPMTPKDVKYSFDLAKSATHPQHPLWADTGLLSTKVSGNDVVFTFSSRPRLPAVRLLPLQRRDRPAAHLQELQGGRHRDRQPRGHEEDRRHRPVHVPVGRRRDLDDGRVEEAQRLVGVEGARPERRADLRGRHQERHERGRAVEPARRQHRPVQQLRPEDGDQGQVQDVLRRRSVPPRRQHDVALPEHDEEAARTTRSSAARSRRRST